MVKIRFNGRKNGVQPDDLARTTESVKGKPPFVGIQLDRGLASKLDNAARWLSQQFGDDKEVGYKPLSQALFEAVIYQDDGGLAWSSHRLGYSEKPPEPLMVEILGMREHPDRYSSVWKDPGIVYANSIPLGFSEDCKTMAKKLKDLQSEGKIRGDLVVGSGKTIFSGLTVSTVWISEEASGLAARPPAKRLD